MPDGLLFREAAVDLERRDAAVRPATFSADARTVEAVIATGTPVERRDARGAYQEVLDVAGADLTALRGAPVLDAHRQDGGVAAIIGTVESAAVENGAIVARLRLSSRPELAGVVADICDGVIANVSVGYSVEAWADGEAGGQRTRTATRWTPREVSFVAVGADRNARTRGGGGRAEVNRQIRALAAEAGIETRVADELIDREATIEQAREAVLHNLMTRGRTSIRATAAPALDDPQVFIAAAGEALYCRTAPAHTPSTMARQYLGMRVDELARESLRRSGVATTGLHGEALITRALHSVSDFPLILADTVGRTMRDAYRVPASGVRQLAREASAPDFRTRHRLMLDSGAIGLEKVNEAGEFRSGTMAEEEQTYALATFGRIFGITRQALVNDDLGAFTDLTRRLGQAAVAFEAQQLVDLLQAASGVGPTMSDTHPLFYSGHANLAASGAVISDTTLSAARLAMRKQTGPGGALIAVTPRYLLVPPELETAAEKELTAIQARTTADVNVFSTLVLIVEPRLSSATRWYLVADPAVSDGLEYAYLAGASGPQTESQVGFRVDGVEVKIRLDFGSGFVDWRSWYSNPGA